MSQGYVPGPVQVFVGTGTSAAWEFLGYSQDGVNLQLVGATEDVMCDVSGPLLPIDVQQMGEQAFISLTLNKYNEPVMQKMARRRFGAGVVPGAIEANGLGSLMIAESYAVPILLLFPYRSKTFQSGTIVPCYNFSAGWLNDDFTVPVSVRLKALRVNFRAIMVWNSVALTSVLYTNTLPSPVPTAD